MGATLYVGLLGGEACFERDEDANGVRVYPRDIGGE
jgi:hypothetical protein